MASSRIVMTPFCDDYGRTRGWQAKDEASGALLATAVTADFIENTQVHVVEETHYDPTGAITYVGRLFFNANNEAITSVPQQGTKRREIFIRNPFSRF
jgi:hypothetical protein